MPHYAIVTPMKAINSKTSVRSVSMPKTLYREAVRAAREANMSYSCWIRQLVSKELYRLAAK